MTARDSPCRTPSRAMPATFQLFYVSSASAPQDATAIQAILQIARRNNRRLDITGCLLYSGRHFAQVLEGDENAVKALNLRIAADPRHGPVRVVMESRRSERQYGDWSMGYLHKADFAGELEALMLDGTADPGVVAELLSRMKPDTVMGSL